jgi:hypothetical protein
MKYIVEFHQKFVKMCSQSDELFMKSTVVLWEAKLLSKIRIIKIQLCCKLFKFPSSNFSNLTFSFSPHSICFQTLFQLVSFDFSRFFSYHCSVFVKFPLTFGDKNSNKQKWKRKNQRKLFTKYCFVSGRNLFELSIFLKWCSLSSELLDSFDTIFEWFLRFRLGRASLASDDLL